MSKKNNDSRSKTMEQIRKLHNRELLRKLDQGESTTSFDAMLSWFPPRPKIEKDKKIMDKLYGASEAGQGGKNSDQKPHQNSKLQTSTLSPPKAKKSLQSTSTKADQLTSFDSHLGRNSDSSTSGDDGPVSQTTPNQKNAKNVLDIDKFRKDHL